MKNSGTSYPFKVFVVLVMIGVLRCAGTKPGYEDIFPKVIVSMKTSMGDIELELYPEKAPASVVNFLYYAGSGHYNNTLFHRVIDDFMIQGGGYDMNMVHRPEKDPIVNEATNGLKNYRGTIGCARTHIINSATSEFYINLVDNPFLDHSDRTPEGFGYAVFGRVSKGMKVVDAIGSVETEDQMGLSDVPVKPVIILSARIVKEIGKAAEDDVKHD
jgi:cyclophilin family peptidyl-prolyl cis-trans isomerase